MAAGCNSLPTATAHRRSAAKVLRWPAPPTRCAASSTPVGFRQRRRRAQSSWTGRRLSAWCTMMRRMKPSRTGMPRRSTRWGWTRWRLWQPSTPRWRRRRRPVRRSARSKGRRRRQGRVLRRGRMVQFEASADGQPGPSRLPQHGTEGGSRSAWEEGSAQGDGRHPRLSPECDPMTRPSVAISGHDGGVSGCPSPQMGVHRVYSAARQGAEQRRAAEGPTRSNAAAGTQQTAAGSGSSAAAGRRRVGSGRRRSASGRGGSAPWCESGRAAVEAAHNAAAHGSSQLVKAPDAGCSIATWNTRAFCCHDPKVSRQKWRTAQRLMVDNDFAVFQEVHATEAEAALISERCCSRLPACGGWRPGRAFYHDSSKLVCGRPSGRDSRVAWACPPCAQPILGAALGRTCSEHTGGLRSAVLRDIEAIVQSATAAGEPLFLAGDFTFCLEAENGLVTADHGGSGAFAQSRERGRWSRAPQGVTPAHQGRPTRAALEHREFRRVSVSHSSLDRTYTNLSPLAMMHLDLVVHVSDINQRCPSLHVAHSSKRSCAGSHCHPSAGVAAAASAADSRMGDRVGRVRCARACGSCCRSRFGGRRRRQRATPYWGGPAPSPWHGANSRCRRGGQCTPVMRG